MANKSVPIRRSSNKKRRACKRRPRLKLNKLKLRAPKIIPEKHPDTGLACTPTFDKRSFKMMPKIFFHRKGLKKVTPTLEMLKKVKRTVIAELKRQQKLSSTATGAPLEKAFYIATAEPTLFFDYALMLKMVREVQLLHFTPKIDEDWKDAYATTDGVLFKIWINKNVKMDEDELRMTLMHEALHCTVTRRGRRCHPILSTEVEHTAMALLGDPECVAELEWWHYKRVKNFARQGRLKNVGIRHDEDWWLDVIAGYEDDKEYYDNPDLASDFWDSDPGVEDSESEEE